MSVKRNRSGGAGHHGQKARGGPEGQKQSPGAARARQQSAFRNQLADRRRRPAPSAMRTAISRCRALARASIRFATLAQVMSQRTPTMDIKMSKGLRTAGAARTILARPARDATGIGGTLPAPAPIKRQAAHPCRSLAHGLAVDRVGIGERLLLGDAWLQMPT